jgi:hypothetical protein
MNNYWGESDDEPLPDWMNPQTYRNGNQLKKTRQSLEEACAIALTKPTVPVIIQEPRINDE